LSKSQWFVCLNYDGYDLLILQSMVTGSSWDGDGSTILCNGKPFESNVIPHLEKIDLGDCRVFSGVLGEKLRNRGIIGVHFNEHTIQYLIDDRFLEVLKP